MLYSFEDFKYWLEENITEIVGTCGSFSDCPISKYLKDRHIPVSMVIGTYFIVNDSRVEFLDKRFTKAMALIDQISTEQIPLYGYNVLSAITNLTK